MVTTIQHFQSDDIQQDIPNVITVTFRYGQLVPVKVLTWNEAVPDLVCTRWGGIFRQNTQKFYEPVDENSMTIQEREETISLVAAPWILPVKPKAKSYKPGERNHTSNRVEELSDLFARYHYR